MTGSEIYQFPFSPDTVCGLATADPLYLNWPVVYALNSAHQVYVGESLHAGARMRQHLRAWGEDGFVEGRLIIDPTFNKSVCLDLESYLIRLLAGEGRYTVLNSNRGIVDADYYDRESYRRRFAEIFDLLRREDLFEGSVDEIEASELFKLSPFKALNPEQVAAVTGILESLASGLTSDRSTIVVQGEPGTGKTIVAVFLMKLLRDIAQHDPDIDLADDSVFATFFQQAFREKVRDLRIGFVVPQQALRKSLVKVFERTPGLDRGMVLTPFQVGEATERFDVLIVDETHRMTQRANQASGVLNAKFPAINRALFGKDDLTLTQLDWITKQSDHQVFLLDVEQRVRPADLPTGRLHALVDRAKAEDRHFALMSQMRVRGGADYISYIRSLLDPLGLTPVEPRSFQGYDLRFFDDLADLRVELAAREAETGLARLVAGYAWPWRSKKDKQAIDIEIDACRMRWNSTDQAWISSPKAAEEVGSIHTVQGYDLAYAGVIIGRDLRYDPERSRLVFDRAEYHDTKGKENNPRLGRVYDDEDLLELVSNIYTVLLTRGMRGTYVYVCDPALREHLRPFFSV